MVLIQEKDDYYDVLVEGSIVARYNREYLWQIE